MNILKYLEVILEDQATLYAMIRKHETEQYFDEKVDDEMFELFQQAWLDETKLKLKEVDESTDDTS